MTKHKNSKDKSLFYDTFASEFDANMNMYDTQKRIKIVFETLIREDLKEKYLLDAGCGTGWFSKKAVEKGAKVVSLDVGENVLNEVAKKVDSERIVGSIMELPFSDETFDIVVSSEVIEHTPNPRKSFEELARVLKKNGVLALTTPNKVWHPSVVVANAFKLRPYEGYENWVSWKELRKWCNVCSLRLEQIFGFHILPFQLSILHSLIDYCDRFGSGLLGHVMINVGIRAVKK